MCSTYAKIMHVYFAPMGTLSSIHTYVLLLYIAHIAFSLLNLISLFIWNSVRNGIIDEVMNYIYPRTCGGGIKVEIQKSLERWRTKGGDL